VIKKKFIIPKQSSDVHKSRQSSYCLTESFKALPALNTGVVAAEIVISTPVCGFLPLRSALLRVSNVDED